MGSKAIQGSVAFLALVAYAMQAGSFMTNLTAEHPLEAVRKSVEEQLRSVPGFVGTGISSSGAIRGYGQNPDAGRRLPSKLGAIRLEPVVVPDVSASGVGGKG